jgi:hypothetical protein
VIGKIGGVVYTIEFQTKIENGTIRIPKELHDRLGERGGDDSVRVVIYLPDQHFDADYVDHLLAHPVHVDDFTPLRRSEIYDRG